MMVMMDFVCPECGGTEFKKDYISDNNSEIYCTKCGRIIINSDKYEYDHKSWADRNYRPNAWDMCYVNNIKI